MNSLSSCPLKPDTRATPLSLNCTGVEFWPRMLEALRFQNTTWGSLYPAASYFACKIGAALKRC